MGFGRWDSNDWNNYSSSVATKSQQQIFTKTSMQDSLNPLKIAFRESVDSPGNPTSTPIALFSDHTGSMGQLAVEIAKKSQGVIMQSILDRKPISDPHFLCGVVGDAYSDSAPLQVTQFESDLKIASQVENLYIEGNGGGNGGESYSLAWYFVLNKTKCDAITKKRAKGYIFTIGDESPHQYITRDQVKRVFGDDVEADISSENLLKKVSKNWHVFHIIVNAREGQHVVDDWRKLLGERAIMLNDISRMAELIVSTIQITEGQNTDEVADSWNDKGVAALIKKSCKDLKPSLVRL